VLRAWKGKDFPYRFADQGCAYGHNGRMNLRNFLPENPMQGLHWAGFIGVYLLIDWCAYVHPLYGAAITPWNPDAALGMAYWKQVRQRALVPWLLALLLGEGWMRGFAAGVPAAVLGCCVMLLGYAWTGERLRAIAERNPERRTNDQVVWTWLATLALGLLLTSLAFASVLAAFGYISPGAVGAAALQSGLGDFAGALITLPALRFLAQPERRAQFRKLLREPEVLAYLLAAVLLLWIVFTGRLGNREFKHFYLLFLPMIAMAVRKGMVGACLAALTLQFGVLVAIRLGASVQIPFSEVQMLGCTIALVGFFVGITVDDQRAVRQDYQQTLRLAAAGEMAGALAHELNQPLFAMMTYGRACEHFMARGETGKPLDDAVKKMIGEAVRASEVVKRLRGFFAQGTLRLERVPAHELIHEVLERHEAQLRQLDIACQVEGALECVLQVDRLQVELALRNLVANAIDALQEQAAGARRLLIRVTAQADQGVLLEVEDSGPGLTPLEIGRLFEPFRSQKSSGLGLGLVLSRAIVEAHGGKLWAEPGPGGRFCLQFPPDRSDDEN
jgi:signal transduction histidine kinase